MPGATDEAIAIGGDHQGLIISSRMTALTMSCRDTTTIITLGFHEKGEKNEHQQITILV